ncbi:MAG TPA: hypothetical protein VFO65_14695 [Acidimicrobiales bacterium]|nr:hypothetical protein [Acidimicrobiales bacterium]
MTRPVLALIAGLATAALGAQFLGEQELVGTVAVVAGVLFGVVVAEVTISVARSPSPFLLVAVSLVSAAGLVWALWISTGHDLDYADASAWLGVGLGAVSAPVWFRTGGQRGERSRGPTTPAPGD